MLHKTILKALRYSSGQSLLEVVVGIAIATIVLAALLSAITFSLANVQFARNKALATKYAQQSIEWLRAKRGEGWYSLYAKSSPGGTTYCLPASEPDQLNNLLSGGCAANQNINDDLDIFYREVTLTGTPSNDSLKVETVVFWQQGNRQNKEVQNAELTLWQ